MPLFGEWLSETKKLQEESFGHTFPLTDWALDYYQTWNHSAAIKELGEALDELPSWKPWSTLHGQGQLNQRAFVSELVDALHFIANMLVGVGCSDDMLEAAYREKMQVNRDRMASGQYDGITDKCPICRRELYEGRCFFHGEIES